MNLAWISVGALVLAIVLSCVTSINVGVFAIALAWIVGVYVAKMPIATVMGGFPVQLFLTLAGVTLLFTMAQCNGTLDRLAHHAVRLCRGHRGVVPIMYFLLAAGLASIGPGNISTAALVAPMAMATAVRANIPLFLMAIMVGNGANAGSLSPFAPTGIIVNGLMARIGMTGLAFESYVSNLLAHALVAFGGYFLFGGVKLFAEHGTTAAAAPAASGDPSEGPFEFRHWLTMAAIAVLITSVIVGQVNVGMGAFLAATVLVLSGAADDRDAIKRMPWNVIVMVCGVTVLIALLEKAQGIELIGSLIAKLSTRESVTAVVAFLTGGISVYSSTSGVVLPAFLPMVPTLAQQLGGANQVAIALSMNVGGHLVDVSPLSTIGALCIAAVSGDESRKLFNQLLAWGLSMTVVGALICYLVFGRSGLF
jgi:Na+/H+ antiporter NhaD/arsenite permease-like protein